MSLFVRIRNRFLSTLNNLLIFLFYFFSVKNKLRNINSTEFGEFPLHMFMSSKDFSMGMISLYYFLKNSDHKYEVFIHDGGSITKRQINYLSEIRGLNYISEKQSYNKIKSKLFNYKTLIGWRDQFKLAKKLVDLRLFSNNHNYYIYLDSDVLLVKKNLFMDKLIDLYKDGKNPENFFNRDQESAYITDINKLRESFDFKLKERLNSGLIFIKKSCIDYQYINELLSNKVFEEYIKEREWVTEQTLYAIMASNSNNGVKHLPIQYDASLSPDYKNNISLHFLGRIRYFYMIRGVFRLFI